MSDAGRNDPCPCGSGKKYKRCCLPKGGVGVRYTRQDRQLALQAIEEFVDGPGWHEIAEKAQDEFWRELDPQQTAIHAAWIAPLEMPALINFDGGPLLLSHSYFDVEDAARLTILLDGAKQLERVESDDEPPRWNWFGKGKDRKEPVVYGWFSLMGARLVLETNSAERAKRGRRLVERLAGDAVKYRLTRTEDFAQAMMAANEHGPGTAEVLGSLPPELREAGSAAVEQHLTETYEKWLDERIPRLDDMRRRVRGRRGSSRCSKNSKPRTKKPCRAASPLSIRRGCGRSSA